MVLVFKAPHARKRRLDRSSPYEYIGRIINDSLSEIERIYPMSASTTQHQSSQMRECIEECAVCHDICLQTIAHCLTRGGAHAEASHIRLMHDCVQICHTARDFMLRGSDLHHHTCRACAEVCSRCAEDCEKMDASDQRMQTYAESCRRCAESCRQMSAN
jgi:hypothetical protein